MTWQVLHAQWEGGERLSFEAVWDVSLERAEQIVFCCSFFNLLIVTSKQKPRNTQLLSVSIARFLLDVEVREFVLEHNYVC